MQICSLRNRIDWRLFETFSFTKFDLIVEMLHKIDLFCLIICITMLIYRLLKQQFFLILIPWWAARCKKNFTSKIWGRSHQMVPNLQKFFSKTINESPIYSKNIQNFSDDHKIDSMELVFRRSSQRHCYSPCQWNRPFMCGSFPNWFRLLKLTFSIYYRKFFPIYCDRNVSYQMFSMYFLSI